MYVSILISLYTYNATHLLIRLIIIIATHSLPTKMCPKKISTPTFHQHLYPRETVGVWCTSGIEFLYNKHNLIHITMFTLFFSTSTQGSSSSRCRFIFKLFTQIDNFIFVPTFVSSRISSSRRKQLGIIHGNIPLYPRRCFLGSTSEDSSNLEKKLSTTSELYM